MLLRSRCRLCHPRLHCAHHHARNLLLFSHLFPSIQSPTRRVAHLSDKAATLSSPLRITCRKTERRLLEEEEEKEDERGESGATIAPRTSSRFQPLPISIPNPTRLRT
uniref:Uncharacterized protein n=1 Tax=Leersia perrieri TaxID=77586 RepID=A0A0D9W997_9ORYZ